MSNVSTWQKKRLTQEDIIMKRINIFFYISLYYFWIVYIYKSFLSIPRKFVCILGFVEKLLLKVPYWEITFKREALVLIKRLKTLSNPFSTLSIAFSKVSNLSCATRMFSSWVPSFRRVLKAISTQCNSLSFSEFSSDGFTPLCINFATSNHLVAFEFDEDMVKNDKIDWNTDKLITMTSLSTLVTEARWWSRSKSGDTPNLPSICFNDVINLLAFLFIFLANNLYSATLVSTLESPFLLRRAEWRTWTFSLICNMVSLVMPHMSKILIEPSNTSSTHLWPLWREITCWVDGMLRRSSKERYKSWSKDRPVWMDSEEGVDVPSQVFSLLNSSSTLMVLGWDLEGKLMQRTLYLFVICSSKLVLFLFSWIKA